MLYKIDGKGSEEFDGDFLSALAQINSIVIASGVKLEGNLFYFHEAKLTAGAPPDPLRVHKRRNLFFASRYKAHVLEVGFNAGHSALLMLSGSHNLKYTGIDIFANRYTADCGKRMKDFFGDRFELIQGDSRLAMRDLPSGEFDLFHIDGGHDPSVCRSDIENVLRLAPAGGAHMVLDDVGYNPIFELYMEYVASGRLITESAGGRWDSRQSLLARVTAAGAPSPASPSLMATQDVAPLPYLRGLTNIAFIAGCGHSGTTIVANILAAHPLIHVPLQETGAFMNDAAHGIAVMDRLRAAAAKRGKTALVEKSARHVTRLAMIRRLVPSARFILLVRDGRDVVASLGRRTGDFGKGLERWVKETALVLAEHHSGDTLIVRYEDFVVDPAREIRRICEFIGVSFSNELLDYHKEPRLWFGLREIKRTSGIGTDHEHLRNWQVNQPVYDGRGRWRGELPDEILDRFRQGEALRLMLAFGYEPDESRSITRSG